MFIRLGLVLAGVCAAGFFAYEAYWTLAVACSVPGTGSPSMQLLGVALPLSVGLGVLAALALASILFAIYVLFLTKSE